MQKLHKALKGSVKPLETNYDPECEAICADCGEVITSWLFIDDDHSKWSKWRTADKSERCLAEVTAE